MSDFRIPAAGMEHPIIQILVTIESSKAWIKSWTKLSLKCSQKPSTFSLSLARWIQLQFPVLFIEGLFLYRGADKSLARPGRKQTTTEDFDFHISYL